MTAMNKWHYDTFNNCMVKVKALRPTLFIAWFDRPHKRATIINLHGLQLVSRSWRWGIEVVMPWQQGGKLWTR